MAQNITKHYLCMGPTSINHFDPFMRHVSMKMGTLGLQWLFLGQNASPTRRTLETPKWPQSGSICMVALFHIQGGCLVMILPFWANLRRLCYFLPVAIFSTHKQSFSDPYCTRQVAGEGINGPKSCFPMDWDVIWPIRQLPGGFPCPGTSLPSWSILTLKKGIFGHPLTWNGTWRGAKRPQTTFPHV